MTCIVLLLDGNINREKSFLFKTTGGYSMAISKDDIPGSVSEWPITELNELGVEIKEKFGVDAAAPDADASAYVAAGEKSEYSVSLNVIGANKVGLIKAVRELTGLSLKEAVALVEAVPRLVKEGLSKDQAEDVKKSLEEAGGKASLK